MDSIDSKIFDVSEPLSKALNEILRSGSAVFITKNKQLFGLVDDRNTRMGIADASKMKCGNACVKCPSIAKDANVKTCIEAFLAGHFRALPTVDENKKITGMVLRTDLLRELCSKKIIPHAYVYQYMNSPAFTIEHAQTIADAKSIMKKKGVRRLVVTHSGNVVGTISTFDFVGLLMKPKERQSYQLISEVKGFDSKRINEVMRETSNFILENATLEEAAEKMITENVSSLAVVANKKPVGVLSATDIFKIVRKLYESNKDVIVSGLDEESNIYYNRIKEAIIKIVSKFEKSFKIENLAVHIKKMKSIYEANMHFNLNNKQIAFKCEGYSISEVILELANELKIVFEKAKSAKIERKKPWQERK